MRFLVVALLIACGDNLRRAPADARPAFDTPEADTVVDGLVDASAVIPADAAPDTFTFLDANLDPAPPRLLAPLSTATVTSRRPLLRWKLAVGSDGARIQLCAERACTTILETIDAIGTSASPTSDIPSGVVYWRAFGRSGPNVGLQASPTWELFAGIASASRVTWYDTTVDVNGDGFADLAVGAPSTSSGVGAVHIYHGGASGLATTPTTSLAGPDGPSWFGETIATNDVNGDGFGDLVVGAPRWPTGNAVGTKTGRAYVFLGGASGIATTASATIVTPGAEWFGRAVASAGDIDGDGYGDIAIGATVDFGQAGTAYVYRGPHLTTSSPQPAFTLVGFDGAGDSFGRSIEVLGDIDDNGYSDLAVGAPAPPEMFPAKVYVFQFDPAGPRAPIALTDPGATPGRFGFALGVVDLDRDGYVELVVGAPGSATSSAGRAHVYQGSAAGFPSSPTKNLAIGGGEYGGAISRAGDVDGDGFEDMIIGASQLLNSMTLPEGGAHVYRGDVALTLVRWPTLRPPPAGYSFSSFGYAVAGGGDFNRDGFADLAVGAPRKPTGDIGTVFVRPGSATGPAAANPTLAAPGTGSQFFGVALE